MGLFGEDESSSQRELEAQVADLKRQLAAKSGNDIKETSKITDVDIASMEVRQVAIKLPPFSESNPALWFGKAESQFILRGIKDDTTKFHHIYSLLSEKASNEIEDLLLNPPATGKVQAMKERLMTKFDRSQFSKDTELLAMRSLGDLRPSEMWSRFKQLNKDPHNHTSSFVKAYLIGMYPQEVRTVIANMTFADNEEMAKAADKIIDMKSPHVNAIQEEEVPEVDAVFKGGARGRGSNRPGRGQGHSKPQASSAKAGKTCFYHDRHGTLAFKCEGAPCPFINLPLAKQAGNATAGR